MYKWKKLLAMLLMFALVFSLLPPMSLPALEKKTEFCTPDCCDLDGEFICEHCDEDGGIVCEDCDEEDGVICEHEDCVLGEECSHEESGGSTTEAMMTSMMFGVDEKVRVKETGLLFATLSEAIADAKGLGYNDITLEVVGDITETVGVAIGAENVTIVRAEDAGSASITFVGVTSPNITLTGGGTLILGDGTVDNPLTIKGTVEVTNGSIHINDGVEIISTGYKVVSLIGINAKGSINGGHIEAIKKPGEEGKAAKDGIALDLSKGATLSEISGGVFIGVIDAVHLSDVGTKIGRISGGEFYQTEPCEISTLHGHAVFVQNDSQIGEISGGYFEAAAHCALMLIRGGWVDEISGGEFVSLDDTITNNRAINIYAQDGRKTGVGLISDIHVHGGYFGIMLIAGPGSQIGAITGGRFEGKIALQNDRYNIIGEIMGGTFTGTHQGMFNVGTIKKIGGDAEIRGISSYGIFNYYLDATINGLIEEISGGRIISDSSHGIMNIGTIALVSGGTIIGQSSAINSVGSTIKGYLNKITGGVFWGKSLVAIQLAYALDLEPGLRAGKGAGRYMGNGGVIFNNTDLVNFPAHPLTTETYFMSTETLPVSGILGATFKYLTLTEIPEYTVTVNDSYADEGDTGAGNYPDGVLVTIDAGSRNGHVFAGWEVDEGEVELTNPDSAMTTFIMPIEDVTVTANWRLNAVGGGGGVVDADPTPIAVTLEARKTVSGAGATLTAEQFSFAVYENNTLVAAGTNDANGDIVFPAIKYTQDGVHNYKIVETSSSGDGWITDKTEHTVKVTVTNSDNKLSAAVAYQGDAAPTFHNQYNQDKSETVTFNVSKVLFDKNGNTVGDGEDYWVVLYEKAGAEWIWQGEYAITANGSATAISDLEGGKTYQLVEKTGNWFNILGITVFEDSKELGISKGTSVAIAVPALSQSKTIEIVIINEKTGESDGKFGGGEADKDPPLVEIEEEEPPLSPFISEHNAYIFGYPDGLVSPEGYLTRAEAAAIFFKLLTDEISAEYQTEQNPFLDLSVENWFNICVSVMNSMGIVRGYPDGRFNPNGAITRAEFAAITMRFEDVMGLTPENSMDFSDIAGHWAEEDIRHAAAVGWVNGYPDGTFRPNEPITRAEAITLVNCMLGRVPESADDLLTDEMITWTDNADSNAWYYLAIQEATNSHVQRYKGKTVDGLQFEYEYWIEMLEK